MKRSDLIKAALFAGFFGVMAYFAYTSPGHEQNTAGSCPPNVMRDTHTDPPITAETRAVIAKQDQTMRIVMVGYNAMW